MQDLRRFNQGCLKKCVPWHSSCQPAYWFCAALASQRGQDGFPLEKTVEVHHLSLAGSTYHVGESCHPISQIGHPFQPMPGLRQIAPNLGTGLIHQPQMRGRLSVAPRRCAFEQLNCGRQIGLAPMAHQIFAGQVMGGDRVLLLHRLFRPRSAFFPSTCTFSAASFGADGAAGIPRRHTATGKPWWRVKEPMSPAIGTLGAGRMPRCVPISLPVRH